MLKVYLNNTEYGRSQNYGHHAKFVKEQELKRQQQIAAGTYVSYEEFCQRLHDEKGSFFVSDKEETIPKSKAADMLDEYKPIFFTLNDTKKAFQMLEVKSYKYNKEIQLFEVVNECNQAFFAKVTRLDDDTIRIQRLPKEAEENILSTIKK